MASYTTCLAQLRDSYREQKGEPVSEEGQARRLIGKTSGREGPID
jgi:hypothetical protein